MSRKLPKATAETLDGLLRGGAAPEEAELPPPWVEAAPDPVVSAEATAPAAPEPPPPAAPTDEPVTAAAPALSAKSPSEDAVSALRQAQAGRIVERYANYAAVGGLIPLPVLDILGITATVVKMVEALARHYGQPIRRDRARTLVAGLVGGVGQVGAGSVAATTLAKFVPGANFLALMVSSVTASALVRMIGRAFVLHFETGGTALTLDEAAIRAYFAASSGSQPSSRQ